MRNATATPVRRNDRRPVSRAVGHTAAAYWVGKNRSATLFGPAPGGPFGIPPPAAPIGFTLGTILTGLATPTEAASCGAFGATLLALLYRKLTYAKFRNAAVSTIYRGMGQFMVIQLICLLLILVWPGLVLWLPRALE